MFGARDHFAKIVMVCPGFPKIKIEVVRDFQPQVNLRSASFFAVMRNTRIGFSL